MPAHGEFVLPQQAGSVAEYRRRLLEDRRKLYALTIDEHAGSPGLGFRLPPFIASLPGDARFSEEKRRRINGHKRAARANAWMMLPVALASRMRSEAAFRRIVSVLGEPSVADRWRADAEYARQRVAGINPMGIRRCDATLDAVFLRTANDVLTVFGTSVAKAQAAGRLFWTHYPELADARVQAAVAKKGLALAVPSSLFYVDDRGGLRAIAIRLLPEKQAPDAVFCPLDPEPEWLLARAHAQAADAHIHQAVYHLLETHMVSEATAICAARELAPMHPVSQLLTPHFEFNLAIDDLARHDLLSPKGPIDTALAAGVAGVLDLGRLAYSQWSYPERGLHRDLSTRGVDDPQQLPLFPYRDDSLKLWAAIRSYVEAVLAPWYPTDREVHADVELQAWLALTGHPQGGAIPGFPSRVEARLPLFDLLSDVIFRASVQHGAVNNAQFDTYGFVPNAPGHLRGEVPVCRSRRSMDDYWRAMPSTQACFAQISMSWVLSEPTHRSLLESGECEAFQKEIEPTAHAAVADFHRSLRQISYGIQERNREWSVPYEYLDPARVARSTGT